jgi:hypothetical protein
MQEEETWMRRKKEATDKPEMQRCRASLVHERESSMTINQSAYKTLGAGARGSQDF